MEHLPFWLMLESKERNRFGASVAIVVLSVSSKPGICAMVESKLVGIVAALRAAQRLLNIGLGVTLRLVVSTLGIVFGTIMEGAALRYARSGLITLLSFFGIWAYDLTQSLLSNVWTTSAAIRVKTANGPLV
jgi:hypothetical protein